MMEFSYKLSLHMNKYETIETIGEGQYGVVLKAINKQTSQLVAIKKFKEDDSEPETKKVILREVKILQALAHENIIQLKEALRRKGKIFLICEYVEKNLLQIIEESPLSAQRVKNFAYQMIKGIAYMHNKGIIHRDIKPQNLLISKNDQVKICDLGFARFLPPSGVMTDYVATRWYRPPELLIGKGDYETSIDVWSIACVIAEMVDGQPLFGGENDIDQLYLIQKSIGPLTLEHKEYFLKNPKFSGVKFFQTPALQSIDRRYFGKMDKLGIDLLKKMLKMNPSERITASQALNHPYFNRIGTPIQRQAKKSSVIDARNLFEKQDKIDVNRSHIHINNFLNEKGHKITAREDRIGVNKVTGLSKPQKAQKSEEPVSSWVYSGKGKSLGKKPAGSIRQNQMFNQKMKKSKVTKKQIKNHRKEQEQYSDDWDQIDNEDDKKNVHFICEKTDRRLIVDRSEQKKQKSLENKKKIKLFKKDSINIVFNHNHYNLNVVEGGDH